MPKIEGAGGVGARGGPESDFVPIGFFPRFLAPVRASGRWRAAPAPSFFFWGVGRGKGERLARSMQVAPLPKNAIKPRRRRRAGRHVADARSGAIWRLKSRFEKFSLDGRPSWRRAPTRDRSTVLRNVSRRAQDNSEQRRGKREDRRRQRESMAFSGSFFGSGAAPTACEARPAEKAALRPSGAGAADFSPSPPIQANRSGGKGEKKSGKRRPGDRLRRAGPPRLEPQGSGPPRRQAPFGAPRSFAVPNAWANRL